MNSLIERVLTLSKEIENFPLGNCSPSDDPDKQTAYLYSFKDLVKRFISSAKRLDDNELKNMIKDLDTNPEFITEAYDLKADMQGVIDYLCDIKNKPNKVREKPSISEKSAVELSKIIQDCLINESANNLPMICNGYGLNEGTVEEAFKSKANYVYSRISFLTANAIFELGAKMKGKYPNSKLDELLDKLSENDAIDLISEFGNIQERIKQEINKAKLTIWIAVAWFTDKEIANLLYLKSKQGLNIQIVLNDDKINSKLKEKLNEYFEVHWISNLDTFDKIMHNKFCVIDFKTVIHGSYNWTNRARYNDETISVIHNRINTEDFAEQFLKMKTTVHNKV